MAKRKRLTPASEDWLSRTPSGAAAAFASDLPRAAPPPIAQVSADAAGSAAFDELSETLRRAREEGRMVIEVPLDRIDPGYLVRDRMGVAADELDSLRESIRARGQQMPIEVVDTGDGRALRYGLISGWRRLTALQQLSEETRDPRFATALALVRRPEDDRGAYVAMVEENELRVNLSHYERARVALRTVQTGVFPDLGEALRTLFANASRAKRSKIRTFAGLVTALDPVLTFPREMSERTGLALAKFLDETPDGAERLCRALQGKTPVDAEAEAKLLLAATTRRKDTESPGTGSKSASEPKTPRGAVSLSWDGRQRILLSGPGVDAELLSALETFLSRR